MLANEKLYEMKVPNNIVLNPKDGPVVSSFSITGNEKKLQGLAREKFIENFLF